MNITNELVKWARDEMPRNYRMEVLAIADRIDAEHKAAVDKAHADGERNGLQQARSASEDWQRGFDEGFASADDWIAQHGEDMEKHGWIRLPVDADGVPIHIGDVLNNTHKDGFSAKQVFALCLHQDGHWTANVDESRMRWHNVDKLHHCPTTEDVLTELEGMRGGYATYEDVVTRCAELAKTLRELLQLKDVDA